MALYRAHLLRWLLLLLERLRVPTPVSAGRVGRRREGTLRGIRTGYERGLIARMARSTAGHLALSLAVAVPEGPLGRSLRAAVLRRHPLLVYTVAAEDEEQGDEDGDEGDAADHDASDGTTAEAMAAAVVGGAGGAGRGRRGAAGREVALCWGGLTGDEHVWILFCFLKLVFPGHTRVLGLLAVKRSTDGPAYRVDHADHAIANA